MHRRTAVESKDLVGVRRSANDSPGEGGVPEGRGLRCGHWTVPSPEGVEPRHERRVVLEAATTNEGRDIDGLLVCGSLGAISASLYSAH